MNGSIGRHPVLVREPIVHLALRRVANGTGRRYEGDSHTAGGHRQRLKGSLSARAGPRCRGFSGDDTVNVILQGQHVVRLAVRIHDELALVYPGADAGQAGL